MFFGLVVGFFLSAWEIKSQDRALSSLNMIIASERVKHWKQYSGQGGKMVLCIRHLRLFPVIIKMRRTNGHPSNSYICVGQVAHENGIHPNESYSARANGRLITHMFSWTTLSITFLIPCLKKTGRFIETRIVIASNGFLISIALNWRPGRSVAGIDSTITNRRSHG